MSIINNKNVNNQSSLSVDTVNIGIINCNELDTNIINSNGGNLQYVAIGNSTISSTNIINSDISGAAITNTTITDCNVSGGTISGTINGNISGNISNSNYQGIIKGLDVRDISDNVLMTDGVDGFIINGATLKNRTSTKTMISINTNNTSIIPSITSFQIFDSTLSTNSNVSSSKLFQEGVKVINVSYSHYATTAGLFDCKCYIKQSGTNTILKTFTPKRYHISSINIHYTQSFNFLSTNIQTSTIYVVVDIIAGTTGGGVFAASSSQDFISGVMYNLANTE
jgi:uncharacterized protein YjbI with pentapeptide repeats